MLKRISTIIIMSMMLVSSLFSYGQEKTAAELKAEREQLHSELKSKEVVSREEKLAKLAEKAPGTTTVQSVDGLAKTAVGVLIAVVSANETLSQFKREVIDNGDGEIEVTNHSAKLDDYIELAKNLAATTVLIGTGSQQIQAAQNDAKGLAPLKVKPALSSVSFSTDALKLSGEEVALQTKLVNNLISTIKSAKNL
jgi:hypothetical protein